MMIKEMKTLAQQTKDIKALYVEDENADREQTMMIFKMLFKSVDVAFDGEDGWQKYQNSYYDVVFSDISMPRMNGLELSRLIKERDPMQIIVIISAHNTTNHLLKAIEFGIDTFLLKPIEMKQMVLSIKKIASIIEARKIVEEYQEKLENEVKKQTQIIEEQLITDKLTGLQNRYALNKTLETAEEDISLILVNIDNFDNINIVYGYEAGDKVILFLSMLLAKKMEKNSNLFYLGNDEIAIIYDNSIQNIMNYSKILQEAISELVVQFDNHDIKFTATIAIAKGGNELLKHAYMALKEAKYQGKNNIKTYSKDLVVEKLHAQIQKFSPIIRDAIDKNHIVPYFQAIVDNKTKKIAKYECLARIVIDDKIYSPFEFINISEKIGVIAEITKIIIDKSFKAFQNSDHTFSINITEIDLSNNYLQEYFAQKLQEYDIDVSRVVLEVLEGISVTGAKNSLEQLAALQKMGFSISIDDFGAEHSNFERVHNMNVDFIKIDGSFVKNMDTNPKSYSIVKTITDFAKSIGAKTIAEYVHSQKVAEMVDELGIEYSQGYYYSEPKEELIYAV